MRVLSLLLFLEAAAGMPTGRQMAGTRRLQPGTHAEVKVELDRLINAVS